MNKQYKTLFIAGIVILTIAMTAQGRLPILFKKGENDLDDGRYKEALEVFEECLDKPGMRLREEVRIRRAMVQAYIGLKDWDSAARELRWLINKTESSSAKQPLEELLKIIIAPEDPGVVVENLGPAVNSRYEELAPVISPDGKMLYFIIDNPPTGIGKQDIYFSKFGDNGRWQPAENIGQPLNTKSHDGVLSISPDGTTALLSGVYRRDGSKDNGYSLARMRGGRWRNPEEMDIIDYYNKNQYTSAFMSANGKTLLLALERDDSYGDLDIYVSFLRSDGKWTEPLNIGSDVNTNGTDGTPFLAPDGKTLYFSTDGRPGLGSSDMYKTERLDDSWTKWSKPVNLGKQVNTIGWDAYYTIPAQGDIAYFVSSGEGSYGMSDIWKITLPQEARPSAVVTVSGRVMEPDSTPVGADISWEKLATGENIGMAHSNDVTGEYMIVLPVGEAYGYVAEKEDYLPSSAHLDLTDASAYNEVHHDIIITPIAKGAQTVLHNIFFDFDKATLRPESFGELRRVRDFMEKHSKLTVEIAGHTDNVGSEAYNQKLSTERAQAVATWLIENGIKSHRLLVKGYGESQPVVSNETEEGRQKNRRVVFEIIDI